MYPQSSLKYFEKNTVCILTHTYESTINIAIPSALFLEF